MNDMPPIKKYSDLLKGSALFRGLGEDELEKALNILRAEYGSCGKGELLHPPYTEMRVFGFVLSGGVQACMDDAEGNRMIMAEVIPGVTFGEAVCFLKLKEPPVYICASAPSELLRLSPEALFGNVRDPLTLRLQENFTAMLAARTLSMNDRIQVLSKVKLRDKLLTYFTQLSQAGKLRTFQLPMNRNDLAAYLGTDRSALSRELSRMKKEGLIDYRGNTVKLLKAECGIRNAE